MVFHSPSASSAPLVRALGRCPHVMPRLFGALCLIALAPMGCDRPGFSQDGTQSRYVQQPPSRDGTGKVYMGREIARVMGHRGAGWLERPSRATEEFPDRVVKALGLDSADVVADIGAGTGYFTFRLSPYVPRGAVLAVDIQPEMLRIIQEQKARRETHNVKPILGTLTNPNLPADSVDLALLVDAYHEFSHPYEMMTRIVDALKPGGRVVLVEYRGEDPTVPIKPLHKMTEAQARKELEAAGLVWRATEHFLPQQHFIVFEKPMRTN